MKKLITGVLAMLACFACFTGCNFDFKQPLDSNQQNSSVEETSNPLDDAAAYLEEMYRVSHKETRKDYEVVSEVLGFAVTWSVDVTTAVTVEQGSGTAMTKIVINKTLEADTAYVLTATLTDAEGNTKTVTFNRKALAALATVPQIVETAPVEGTAYKYYVYQSTKDLDLYFAGDMDGYYFSTTENYEEATDLYVEYVEGSDTTFNVYFNHAEDGKQYIGVKVSDDGAHDNIVYAATPPSSFVWNAELGTITTHLEVNKQGKAADYYLGNYSTHTTISASMLSYAGGSGNNVGKLVVLVDKSSIPAETKIATVKDTIDVQTTHKVDKTLELKTTNDLYPEVAIAWSVEGEGAVLTDNELALTIPEQAATVTLTATLTCGEATDTKVFTLTLGPSIPTPTTAEEIVNAAYSLAENETLPGTYTLTGVITKVNTAFSADYSNVTVTIVVGDMTDKAIECYRLKGEGADVIKVGDTITVTGTLKNYNGKVEFDSGCTLDSYVAGEGGEVETPSEAEAILNALYALSDGESVTGEFVLTGKITALDSYNNPTIVVEGFEDKPVYCYKLVVDNAIGDTITVKATSMKNYMGTYEFMNCTLVSNDNEGGEGGGEGEVTGSMINLTVTSLNAPTAYSTSNTSATVDGVEFTYVQIANYGNGLQWRTKDGVSGSLWNSTALPGKLIKIVLIPNQTKMGDYSNEYTLALGNTNACNDKTMNVATNGKNTVTITIEGSYTYFKLTHANTFTQYFDAIEVYYGASEGGEVTPPEGGETPAPHEHSYTTVVTAPTCTEAGYTTYTCECGVSYTADEVAATGHTYVESVEKDPTCTETGVKKFACSCGDSYTEEIAALGHKYESVVTAPTCTQAGYTTYTCACGEFYTADEVVATGHADENEDYKCDVCSTVVEPAADSTLTVAQAVALAKALGTGKDSTNKYYMTVIIESIYNTQYGNANVIDANGDKCVIYGMYSFDGKIRYDALSYKPVAGDEITVYGTVGSYNTTYQMKNGWLDEVVAHEHSYTAVVTDPTCTVDGYTTHTCSICQATYVDGETPATGHSTEEGTCEYCGKVIGGDAPAEPEVLAIFDFGANSSPSHVDGNDLGASKSYTVGTYTLKLTDMSKVYGPAYDKKGNSCIKLGTSKLVGTFTFTVANDVNKVVIYVAKYKANNTKIQVNGTDYTLTKNSDNGEYDVIEVDTSSTKTVTLTTVASTYRAMVNTIEFWS